MIYLVGDAAAEVKVSTVGGIVTPAFAAPWVWHNPFCTVACNAELSALRRELSTHWLIRRTLHHFKQKDYSQLVDLLDASTRASLGKKLTATNPRACYGT